MPHHLEKATKRILLFLLLITIIGGENNNSEQNTYRTAYEKASQMPENYLLNSTLIQSGGPEFSKRQIELLHDLIVHIWCKNQDDIPGRNNHISRDYVDLKHNKTTYYLHTFVCVKDEHQVCDDQLYRQDSTQSLAQFEKLFVNTTDGNTIFVKEIERSIICEYKVHLLVSQLSYEDRFHALGITFETVKEIPGSEKREMIEQGLKVAYKYMIQRDAAVNEHCKTLPVEPFIVREVFLIKKVDTFETRTFEPAGKQKRKANGIDFSDFERSMFLWFHSTTTTVIFLIFLACAYLYERFWMRLADRGINTV